MTVPLLTRRLFGATIFLSSFLLFLVEPLAAKSLLPVFGGSAAVWLTCLVFFQTAVLAGYLYAHLRRSSDSVHVVLLVFALVAAIYWITARNGTPHSLSHPVTAIFTALSFSIGLPFLLLASTSPLLQLWFARISGEGVPYRWFALSNLASLLALAAYPTLIEPHFTLKVQRIGWCTGFAVFVLLSGLLLWRARSAQSAVQAASKTIEGESAEPSSFQTKLLWLLLPAVASMQLSAITRHLTENIAAIPLLWILPLATYLLTLIIAFQFSRFAPRGIVVRFLALMLASLGYMLSKIDVSFPVKVSIPFYLLELFVACLFCHNTACELKPRRSSESTLFYLLFAAGGALGSFFVGIASPLLFTFNYDLALSFLATALLALVVAWNDRTQRILWSCASLLLCYLLFLWHAAYQHNTLAAVRNFYGSLRATQTNAGYDGPVRTLTNGTIKHGIQIFSPTLSHTPTSYYAQDSGIGLALRYCCTGRPRNIGVVGLGVGTIAAYGHPGDRIRFYEINPAVLPIAQNLFTYLRDSPASITYAIGDARNSLTSEAPQNFDVLAIDAFSGDAIPLHLLTREVMAVYLRQLAPNGILAFHISNQYVDLEPEVGILARETGMHAQTVLSSENNERGEFRAYWVLLTRNEAFFSQPGVVLRGTSARVRTDVPAWTDDYSSLLPIVQW